MSTQIYLDCAIPNKWTVWYHKQDDADWSLESYIKLYEFSSLLEYVRFRNSFVYLPQFLNGYYFFMVDDIPPQWEDKLNSNGGCFYLPLPKDVTELNVWLLLDKAIIGDLLENDKTYGISIVPKKYNSIIKIWNGDKSKNNVDIIKYKLSSSIKIEDIYYRAHVNSNNYGKPIKNN